MKALNITVATQEELIKDILSRRNQRATTYSFSSYQDLHETLTPLRIAIMKAAAGRETVSDQKIAEQLNLDVDAIRDDLAALANVGLIVQNSPGFVTVPYERLRIEIIL